MPNITNCPRCGFDYEETSEENAKDPNRLCGSCLSEMGMPTNDEILKLQKEGHTFHCAMRILTGDGECECNKNDFIPGNISRGMYAGRCPVCLRIDSSGHEDWCRNKK